MRVTAAIVGIGLLAAGQSPLAQAIDPALTAAIAGRDEAGIKRDPAAIAKYTADDWAAINPSGGRMTKQQRVDQLKRPAAPGSTPAPPMRTEAVHMYGAAAAVARMKQRHNRQIAVWIRNASGWQAVAIHVVPDALLPVPSTQERLKTAEPSTLSAPAGLSGDRAAIFAAFKTIQDAFYSGDRATYDRMTAPEHARLLPGGVIRFATEGSSNINGPRTQIKYSNITVQGWDSVGVVRWLETNAAGQNMWLTRVFAKTASGWQQVATASSRAADPAITP